MAHSKTSTVKNKYKSPNHSSSLNTKISKKNTDAGSKSRISKSAKPSRNLKNGVSNGAKFRTKPKTYTEKELGIPALNMITPVGVQKPKNKKKGKIFVDDAESMMTILSIVNAEKSGQIESKMIKSRQMEEIREARRAESEKKQEIKKSKMNELKESMRKKRNRIHRVEGDVPNTEKDVGSKLKPKKRVSFTSGGGS
ncbi:60S ribosomal subunit assembly/export protein [Erysiphe necator]|nr:60S ribosomal subunit assembly/export protein [Erysiphe necator]